MVTEKVTLLEKYPQLCKEWNAEKNGDFTPTLATPGSHKKVWWKCDKGHEWDASIANRVKGKGCPYCSGRKAWPGESDLETLFPLIASEWDEDKNGSVKPSTIRPGCNKKYWWKCKYGHEWPATPNHRTQGKGCPYCAHQRVTTEIALQNLFPTIADEWDYEQNEKTPAEYSASSNVKVSWKCKTCGHKWESTIYNRTHNNSGCPACANRVVIEGRNDLTTTFPLVAAEWDYDKNEFPPTSVVAGSEKKVWWKCRFGHSWEAQINTRSNGVGCPICSKYRRVSLPEFTIFYYIKKTFECAINSYKIPDTQNKEIDVYIPSQAAGIEYDGQHWHKDSERDIEKDEVCKNKAIKLIRIREPLCAHYHRDGPTFYLKDSSLTALGDSINWALTELGVAHPEVDVTNDLPGILTEYRRDVINNSFGEKYPQLAKEWDTANNGTLTPYNIPATASKTKVYWKCSKCGYEWKASTDDRISGTGCPVCAGRVVMPGYNDLASQKESLAKEWSNRNGELKPNMVTLGSHKKVWWICDKGHEWKASIGDRVRGTGCPYCAGRKVWVGFNDLAFINPTLAAEWDVSNSKSPTEVIISSGYKAIWRCSKCGHKWKAQVFSRTRGTGCPKCARNRSK